MNVQEISIFDISSQLGLTMHEIQEIVTRLERFPTLTELSMLSVEWSEHCSYRRSRSYFSKFPRKGPAQVLVGEDAGGIVLEDLAILFKVESHNHPSQVEPKHGAATGVGGIIRDILANGAKPIALLNSLRFGLLSDTANQRLFKNVVDGIQWYGNSIGIPTVGGEVDFHPAYAGNCLVNVMCLGIAKKEKLLSTKARPGCDVMILGSRTGRDGIGGCSVLASQEMREALSKRPTVQIGDPYFGKCLVEATLEAASKNLFVALKDMGAAGLTCTTSEMSAAGRCGMEIDVTKIPAREARMEPWEFMMSESQERMLAVVLPKNVPEVRSIFHKWGLHAEVIGKTIHEMLVKIYAGSELVGSLPTKLLVEPPPVKPEIHKPYAAKKELIIPPISDLQKTILEFLAHPSLVSKKWVWIQYDQMVQTNTVVGPGSDAAVLRVPGKEWGLAVVMEGNGRYCKINPYLGAQYVVAEAARNLAAVGARPLAITDGLNFGNPDKPDAYSEFVEVMEGLTRACHELGLPVVSGNVSFYNESPQGRILPTPIVGMVGRCSNIQKITPMAFQKAGDLIYLLGARVFDLSGSLFLEFLKTESKALPSLNWHLEKLTSETIIRLQAEELIKSCHDVGQGGLLTALVECVTQSGFGVEISEKLTLEELLSEGPSRFVVTIEPSKQKAFLKFIEGKHLANCKLGTVGGDLLHINGLFTIYNRKLLDICENTLPKLLN